MRDEPDAHRVTLQSDDPSPTPIEPAAPCTFNVGNLLISEPCPKCGHTGMVHPHAANKVTHCLICEFMQVIALAKQRLGG